MITLKELDELDVGTPIELIRVIDQYVYRFTRTEQLTWLRDDGIIFPTKDFERYLDNIRLLPLEMLAALSEEAK